MKVFLIHLVHMVPEIINVEMGSLARSGKTCLAALNRREKTFWFIKHEYLGNSTLEIRS
jgi:hypothetical protein